MKTYATALSIGDTDVLFLFHHSSDFLGFYRVNVAIGIAEVEGAIVAATHGYQPLHR